MKHIILGFVLLLLSQQAIAQIPTIACSAICPAGDIELTEIPTTHTSYFCTSDGIQATGLLGSNQQATFRAGDRIIFTAGFKAEMGSRLHAVTDNCEGIVPMSGRNSGTSTSMSFKIAPNPIVQTAQLVVRLPEAAELSIRLFNIHGQLMQVLAAHEFYERGAHEFQIVANGLAAGIYFAHVYLSNEVHTKRIIIAK